MTSVLKLLIIAGVLLGQRYLEGMGLLLYLEQALASISYWVWPLGFIVYVLLLALPFVPSVEIGIVMMLILGPLGIILAYIGSISGLLVSYYFGQRVRHNNQIPVWLNKVLKSKVTHYAYSKGAFAGLIILLNLPGNIAFGGGGGIAFNYGYLGALTSWQFMVYSAIATIPGPLLFMFKYLYLAS